MAAYHPQCWAEQFAQEDARQSQQQTAYLLLKGKAEEQLGLSEEIVEGLLITLEALKLAISSGSVGTIRSLDALAATTAGKLTSRLAEASLYIKLLEKSK